jgi:hypothetical protein
MWLLLPRTGRRRSRNAAQCSTPSQPTYATRRVGLAPVEVEIKLGYWMPLTEARRITGWYDDQILQKGKEQARIGHEQGTPIADNVSVSALGSVTDTLHVTLVFLTTGTCSSLACCMLHVACQLRRLLPIPCPIDLGDDRRTTQPLPLPLPLPLRGGSCMAWWDPSAQPVNDSCQ